jgi:hypothetical protein
VHQELLDRVAKWAMSIGLLRNQAGAHQTLQSSVDLRCADREVDTDLGHRRAPVLVGQELRKHDDILRAEAWLRHSVFSIRECRISP